MTRAQCQSIIIIFFSSITINLCAGIHGARAENITINKCCPSGTYVIKGKKCEDFSYILNFSDIKLYDYNEYYESMSLTDRSLKDINYDLDYGILKQNEYFKNESNDYSEVDLIMYLTETGTLYLEEPNGDIRWRKANSANFCMDYLIDQENKSNTTPKHPTVHFWVVLPDEQEIALRNTFFISIGLLTSCVFLALVLVVYSLLPELRNIGGLVLMAYVASLFSAFLFLGVHQIGTDLNNLACHLLTYFCYYSFLASFCWMNVMSYDIWWTFRCFVNPRPFHRFAGWYRFKVYCAYAFGVPLAMTAFFVTVDQVPMDRFPGFITPNLGRKGCFISGFRQLLYMYTPMMIMILMNWLFFLMTSYEIWSAHRQTAILDTAEDGTRAAHRQHLTRFLLYLKLSIIMGVNWALEVISSFSPNLQIWIISDVYNFLIGLSIFLIFVCKRKILRKLKKRYHAWRNPDSGLIGYRSRSSHNTSSDASQETSLQMCPHPDAFNGRDQLKFE